MPESIRLPGYSTTYISHMSTALATRTVAGIAVPTSPLITAALEFVRAHHEDWLFRHVVRSWILGTAIADRTPQLARRDREVHSLATILHDLAAAANGRFASTDQSFEVDSANAACAFVARQPSFHASEWDNSRKQLLWDAVALHTHAAVAMHKQPEVVATLLGIVTDFRGPAGVPGGVLTTAEWQQVAREFPRSGLRNGVVQQMCGLCRSKPSTTYGTVAGDFGEELVEGYSRRGNRWYDFVMNPVDAE